MIQSRILINKSMTNLMRIVAYCIMVLGIYAFFSPIVDILGYVPFVGGFLKSAASSIVFLGAVIICIPLFLVTFSLAWLIYHPKFGIILVLIALAIVGVIIALD